MALPLLVQWGVGVANLGRGFFSYTGCQLAKSVSYRPGQLKKPRPKLATPVSDSGVGLLRYNRVET